MCSLSHLIIKNGISESIKINNVEFNSSLHCQYPELKDTNDMANGVMVRTCKNCCHSFRAELNPHMIEFCSKGTFNNILLYSLQCCKFYFLDLLDCLTSFYWFKKQPSVLLNAFDLMNEIAFKEASMKTDSDLSCSEDDINSSWTLQHTIGLEVVDQRQEKDILTFLAPYDNDINSKSVEAWPKRKRKFSFSERFMRIKNRIFVPQNKQK